MVCVKGIKLNSKFYLVFTLFLLVIFFAGCTTGPKQQIPAVPEITLDENTGEPALVPIPDPYLASTVKVPAEIEVLFDQGVKLIEAKKWPQAQAHFEQLTQIAPNLSGPWVNLGLSHWRQNNIEPASRAFEQAILTNKINGDAYNLYAVMKREQGDFEKAEALYLEAISVWPHNYVSHRNLGILYDMYMGRFNDAYYHFDMCAKILGKPDKKLRGWMIDIKRRQAKMAKEQSAQGSVAASVTSNNIPKAQNTNKESAE